MDFKNIQVIGDKVIIRITAKSIESIYSKEITRNDGSKVKLFTNVEANEGDDRKSTLFVNVGIVEAIGGGKYHPETGELLPMPDIKVGDTAIVSYEVFNDRNRLLEMDGEDKIVWVNAITTYHSKDRWAYANRKIWKDQLVWSAGEIDEVSQLLGVIRNDRLFSNRPYVFLNHVKDETEKVRPSGIITIETNVEKKDEILEREVISYSMNGREIGTGETILVRRLDTFDIEIAGKKITACNDDDILLTVNEMDKLKAV